jgi:hypothetical protein
MSLLELFFFQIFFITHAIRHVNFDEEIQFCGIIYDLEMPCFLMYSRIESHDALIFSIYIIITAILKIKRRLSIYNALFIQNYKLIIDKDFNEDMGIS